MSGNFVLWNVSSDEADEIQTLSSKGWNELVHAAGTPLNPNNPAAGTFPGWNANTDALIANAMATNTLPTPRDNIPPHNYLCFDAIPDAADRLVLRNKLNALVAAVVAPATSWVNRLELVSVQNHPNEWAVKTPSPAVLAHMNQGNRIDALVDSLIGGGISIEVYMVEGLKIGDDRIATDPDQWHWMKASGYLN